MNSSQNKEAVKKGLELFKEGNIPGIIDMLSDNIVWKNPDNPTVPFSISVEGKTGVLDFFQKFGTFAKVSRFDIDHFVAEGDTVVSYGSYDAVAVPTGKSFTTPIIMTWKFDNTGKISQWESYVNSAAQKIAYE